MKSHASLSALCVEDDDDTRLMLGIQLKSLGLDVNLAATADEALRWSETKDFDLYLLDAWLPDLDGYELCRQVRRRARRANRILFFSGAAHELDRQKGIEAGANAYVFKPNVDELLSTLSTLIAEATVETEASMRRGDFHNESP
ncbi:MAG TPA: response regulator [Pyrinomonadaceae bacterium]